MVYVHWNHCSVLPRFDLLGSPTGVANKALDQSTLSHNVGPLELGSCSLEHCHLCHFGANLSNAGHVMAHPDLRSTRPTFGLGNQDGNCQVDFCALRSLENCRAG